MSGTLSVSQFKADGFRQHSAAEIRQLNAGVDYAISGSTLGTLRLSLADNPEAAEPRRAHPGRVSRQPRLRRRRTTSAAAPTRMPSSTSSPSASQHFDAAGNEYDVTVFGLLRDLANPLAAPPDIDPGPDRRHLRRHRPGGRRRAGSARRRGSARARRRRG